MGSSMTDEENITAAVYGAIEKHPHLPEPALALIVEREHAKRECASGRISAGDVVLYFLQRPHWILLIQRGN